MFMALTEESYSPAEQRSRDLLRLYETLNLTMLWVITESVKSIGTSHLCFQYASLQGIRRLSETMVISEIRVLLKFEFHRGATSRQVVSNINSAFTILVATNATVVRWLKKFRSGDFDLSNEPRGRPNTRWIITSKKPLWKRIPNQSALELSLVYNV
ncbi:planarian mariner-8 gene [Nephila pilipes]|uniref:Planarian mariner-8 protein n=1 Tax=Nephila pilipes TaxID=299642 RepID=A0A8X6T9R9_NEPPI|nr:planarian mariner-8 gene [Nephila pilipes]